MSNISEKGFTPRAHIEDDTSKENLRRRHTLRGSIARIALGVTVGTGILAGGVAVVEHTNAVDVEQEAVDEYRDLLNDVIDRKIVVSDVTAEPFDVTIIDGDTKRTFKVDDDPNTNYDEHQPNYVRALNYVDPDAFRAAGVDTIRVVDNIKSEYALDREAGGAYLSNKPDMIVVDKGVSETASIKYTGGIIRHELMHAIHYGSRQIKIYPRLPNAPQYTNSNPEGFHYKEELPKKFQDDYDTRKGLDVSVSEYASTNFTDDIAELGAALTAPVNSLDAQEIDTTTLLDKLESKDQITIDKTATMLAMLDEVNPGYGMTTLGGIEDNLNRPHYTSKDG